MSKEKECLDILMDSSSSIEEKTSVLGEFIKRWELIGSRTVLGVRGGRSFACDTLFEALPKNNEKAKQQLGNVIHKIIEYNKQRKKRHDAKARDLSRELQSLNDGAIIIIRNGNRKDCVRLIEVKRLRFICEYPDGRQYSVPVENFVGVSKKSAFEPLPDRIRQLRDLVRNLVGRRSNQAKAEIVKYGVEILNILLDELAATFERIENAPCGISGGVLGAALGPVKKVNPRDEALVKRIPEVIAEIAQKTGTQKVQRRIKSYPNAAVREHCDIILDKLKP